MTNIENNLEKKNLSPTLNSIKLTEDKHLKLQCQVAIISFITHSSHLNYGATLHGYAFQTYLRKKGVESVVIDYIPKVVEEDNLKYPILITRGDRSYPRWIAFKINWLLGFFSNLRRYREFNRFINSNIVKTDTVYSYEELKKANDIDGKKFPIYVCESDVIWKIVSLASIDDNFFLSFPAAEGSRKIAYAPSLSSRELTGKVLERFKELIKPFSTISAREKQGADYLKKITGRDVEWVLDPTLLLDSQHYDNIVKQPKDKNYLLIYNVSLNDVKMVKEAVRYGKKHGLKVIELSVYSLNRFIVPHKVIVGASIEEWIGYIKHATVIVTNSFHGFCFSVLYHKDVFLFQRNDEDYKLQNIADTLLLSNRLVSHNVKKIPLGVDDINWEEVDKRLNEMRSISSDFIRNKIIQYC